MGAQLRDTVTTAPARLLPLSLEASVAVLLYRAQEKTKETMTRNKKKLLPMECLPLAAACGQGKDT